MTRSKRATTKSPRKRKRARTTTRTTTRTKRTTKRTTTRTTKRTTSTKTKTKTSPTTTSVALSLGANLGQPEHQLRAALERLRQTLGGIRVAPLFRSRALGPPPQPDYLNTALVARCRLAPDELLAVAKAVEREAGRRRGPRFGPRPLDIDLLLFGDLVSAAPELTVPHPRLAERRFYLEPLARLAPGLRVPPAGRTVAELLAAAPREPEVVEIGWTRPTPV